MLISYTSHQIVRGGLYSSLKDNYVLGVGIGSLAAVATSCCTHVAELAHVALDIVRLALSVGLYTKRVRSSVDTSNSSTSWSMTITPLSIKSAQQIIADFHSTNVREPLKTVFVGLPLSAIASNVPLIC